MFNTLSGSQIDMFKFFDNYGKFMFRSNPFPAIDGNCSPCANPGIFVRGGGGVQVSLTKIKSDNVFFFSPQLILQKSNGQFQRNLSFFKVPEGVQHFPGGGGGGGEVHLFPGGSNCLFPIENHICDFLGGGGGPDPLSSPLDPHL